MRFLVTGDWQCTVENIPKCQIVVDHILELVKSRKLDAVIILGDVKHILNPVDCRVLNFLSDSIKAIKAVCEVFVLLGNHDRTTTKDDKAACRC